MIDLPVSFTVPEADGSPRRIHTPMVDVRVGGVASRLILDSGASDHVFTRSLARSLEVGLGRVEDGRDHAGAAVPTYVADRPLELALGAHVVAAPAALVIEGPPPFEGWGIGGFLAPQLLDGQGFVELDLRTDRLRVWRGAEEEVVGAVGALHPDARVTPLRRVAAQGDAERLPLVEGRVAGRSVVVLLNTGTARSELPGWLGSGDSSEIGRGVSGEAVVAVVRRGTFELDLHGATVALKDVALRAKSERADDAQLGLDALRGTALLFAGDPARPIHWYR